MEGLHQLGVKVASRQTRPVLASVTAGYHAWAQRLPERLNRRRDVHEAEHRRELLSVNRLVAQDRRLVVQPPSEEEAPLPGREALRDVSQPGQVPQDHQRRHRAEIARLPEAGHHCQQLQYRLWGAFAGY